MKAPELWLVAGPNGAGKTTLVQQEPLRDLLPHVRFVNADDQTLERLRDRGFAEFADAPPDVQRETFIASAEAVLRELEQAIAEGEAIGVESVLSTGKYEPLVDEVLRRGGTFHFVYVALDSPDRAVRRVASRVGEGGHGVPADRIAARWHRSLEHLPRFARRATWFWIYDNSNVETDVAPTLVASGGDGKVEVHEPAFAELASALDSIERD
jgi:predicted ABC-type ATPase